MTDEFVPPGRQCVMCDAPAVDPETTHPLCETHAARLGESAVESTAEGNSPATDQADADIDTDTDAPTATDDADLGPGGDGRSHLAEPSGRQFYPDGLKSREWWVNWVLAVRREDIAGGDPDPAAKPTKQPVAPYDRGDAAPARWNETIPDEDHPRSSFDTVEAYEGMQIGLDLPAPDRVVSDEVGIGIIQEPAAETDGRPITLLDWDDVRRPETGEIHPVCAWALAELDGFAEISQSGEGIHQFVYGEVPGGLRQFLRHVDDDPFVGDDRPMIEMYSGTRLTAMTGRHIAGCGDDLVDGQELIDELCWRFGTGSNNSTQTPSDPFARKRGADAAGETDDGGDSVPGHAAVEKAVREAHEYDGDDPAEWELGDDESIRYAAVLRAWELDKKPANVAHWQLMGYAAALGVQLGKDQAEVVDDLAEYEPRRRAEREVRSVYRKAERGAVSAPSVATLQQKGLLPELDGDTGESVAILPPAVRDLSPATSGWDWRHTATTDDATVSTDTARDRTTAAIADAYDAGDRVLVEALPTTGKSFGAVKAAAETDEPVTLLTGRGRKEQYEQFREWCERFDLDHYTLPSFFHDCPTASGQFGDEWRDLVAALYNRGASPKTIHKLAETVLDQPLPCHDDGACPLSRKWDFDPDDYDVLIGHYNHAHRKTVTSGRTVVFDEFPAAFSESVAAGGETTLQAAVSAWLDRNPAVPYEDYTDLVENRDDDERRSDALLWFENNGVDRDESAVLDDPDAHADAALAVFAVLAGDDLGNGWEHAVLPDGDTRVARNRRTGQVSAIKPPDLTYASGVVALDGTPTQRLWELSLGQRLNHRQVLTDAERREYIRDGLNLNLVRTSEFVKPYNSADHVAVDQDAALLEAIHDEHDEKPSVVTTATAEAEFEDSDAANYVADIRHYGNVLGSNELREKRVGAVIGSNHYGDDYLKMWGAFAGETVARNDQKGADLSYGPFGDDVLAHMRDHETLQAAMRFGRDGNGAVVYVHTDTLPDWVPIAAEGRVRGTWSDGMREVLTEAQHREEFSTREIADAVDLSARQVRDHLHTLAEDGYVAAEYDGTGYVWRDDGLHRVNDAGEVELEPVGDDELDADESAEVARSSIYTWDFRPIAPPDAKEPPSADAGATPGRVEADETGVSGRHTPE